MKGRTHNYESQRAFVTAWQQADNVAEVCKALGMEANRVNTSTVSTRACKLRDLGVPLKKFRPRSVMDARQPLSQSELDDLAGLAMTVVLP